MAAAAAETSITVSLDLTQPLLTSQNENSPPPPPPTTRSNRLSLLLGRASGRRGGGASTLVRETAATQFEQRRVDWAYSKPVVALDITWNLVFTIVSVVFISSTLDEKPNTPIRVWICGYAIQCVIHVVMVWSEYRRRRNRRRGDGNGSRSSDSDVNGSEEDEENGVDVILRSSVAKRCESLNSIASFMWWIAGFYWVVSGGEVLLQNAPRLYWLAVVFLAFDVFFAIFCAALACVIGIAVCCCLPCIIAILYAVVGQDFLNAMQEDVMQEEDLQEEENGETS